MCLFFTFDHQTSPPDFCGQIMFNKIGGDKDISNKAIALFEKNWPMKRKFFWAQSDLIDNNFRRL